jgi:transcriptional antiterminator
MFSLAFFCVGLGLLVASVGYVRRLKKEIIHQLPSIFDTVSSIKIEKLSEILGISPKTVRRIISSYKTELLELGLELKYEKGLIFKHISK